MAESRVVLENVNEALADMEAQTLGKMYLVAGAVGQQTVANLRAFTDEFAPPIRRGDPPRRRHWGYWADRKGQLAAGYAARVEIHPPNSVAIVLENPVEYAEALEARDGYKVLDGVADRGAPVEQALRSVVPRLAGDWIIRSYD